MISSEPLVLVFALITQVHKSLLKQAACGLKA